MLQKEKMKNHIIFRLKKMAPPLFYTMFNVDCENSKEDIQTSSRLLHTYLEVASKHAQVESKPYPQPANLKGTLLGPHLEI